MVPRAVELLERLPPGPELALAYANVSRSQMVVEDGEAAAAGCASARVAERSATPRPSVYRPSESRRRGGRGLAGGRRRSSNRPWRVAAARGLVDQVGRCRPHPRPGAERRTTRLADASGAKGSALLREHGLDLSGCYLLAMRARMELDGATGTEAAASAAPSSIRAVQPSRCSALARARSRPRAARRSGVVAAAGRGAALAEPTGRALRIAPVAAAQSEAAWLDGRSDAVAGQTEAALELADRTRAPWAIGELACWRGARARRRARPSVSRALSRCSSTATGQRPPAWDAARLSVRGGARARRRGRGGAAPPGARRAATAGSEAGSCDRRAAPAGAGRPRLPARPTAGTREQPGWAHRAGARGAARCSPKGFATP